MKLREVNGLCLIFQIMVNKDVLSFSGACFKRNGGLSCQRRTREGKGQIHISGYFIIEIALRCEGRCRCDFLSIVILQDFSGCLVVQFAGKRVFYAAMQLAVCHAVRNGYGIRRIHFMSGCGQLTLMLCQNSGDCVIRL